MKTKKIEKLIEEQRRHMKFEDKKSSVSPLSQKKFVTIKQADLMAKQTVQKPSFDTARQPLSPERFKPTAYVSDKETKKRDDYVDIRDLKRKKIRQEEEKRIKEEEEKNARQVAEVADTPPVSKGRKFLSIDEILAKRGITVPSGDDEEAKNDLAKPKKPAQKRPKKKLVDSDLMDQSKKKKNSSFFDDF